MDDKYDFAPAPSHHPTECARCARDSAGTPEKRRGAGRRSLARSLGIDRL